MIYKVKKKTTQYGDTHTHTHIHIGMYRDLSGVYEEGDKLL